MRKHSTEQAINQPQGAGVTSQGGPIPIPCGGTAYVDWDRPSRKVMEYMVQNPEFYLKMTEPGARKMMAQDIADAARELGMSGDNLKKLDSRLREMK